MLGGVIPPFCEIASFLSKGSVGFQPPFLQHSRKKRLYRSFPSCSLLYAVKNVRLATRRENLSLASVFPRHCDFINCHTSHNFFLQKWLLQLYSLALDIVANTVVSLLLIKFLRRYKTNKEKTWCKCTTNFYRLFTVAACRVTLWSGEVLLRRAADVPLSRNIEQRESFMSSEYSTWFHFAWNVSRLLSGE